MCEVYKQKLTSNFSKVAHDCIHFEDTQIALPVTEIGPALCSITEDEFNDLERTRKVALKIILKDQYKSYSNALSIDKLQTLIARRETYIKLVVIPPVTK